VGPDPLAGDDVGTARTGHQIPGLVGEEGRILRFHRMAPVRVRQGLADGRGYRRDPRLAGSGGEGLRAGRLPRHHRVSVTRVPVKERRVVDRRGDTGTRRSRRR
jgi:hypothetical protein